MTACDGDFGGPLVCGDDDVLFGIISRGDPEKYVIFTRVDVVIIIHDYKNLCCDIYVYSIYSNLLYTIFLFFFLGIWLDCSSYIRRYGKKLSSGA